MRNRGFTLLETLVALAIVGIAMAAAMRSTQFAVDTVAELRTRTAAAWVAQNVVNESLAARHFPEVGMTGGESVQGRQAFLWRQEVRPTPNYSFRRLEVTVFPAERPGHAVARQVNYVARQQD